MNSKKLLQCSIILTIVVAFSTLALAGPPLICHAIQIGSARTLPWVDLNYKNGDGGYDLKNLASDTLGILDSNNSVLVHMETLRRATVYARQDQQAAKEVLVRLHSRATGSDAASNSLKWFDLGYFAALEKQWTGIGEPNPASSLDGYALIKKALSMGNSDPEMEFAAALVTLGGPKGEHDEHVRKAFDGANTDALLAQNLKSNFDKQTISSLMPPGDHK